MSREELMSDAYQASRMAGEQIAEKAVGPQLASMFPDIALDLIGKLVAIVVNLSAIANMNTPPETMLSMMTGTPIEDLDLIDHLLVVMASNTLRHLHEMGVDATLLTHMTMMLSILNAIDAPGTFVTPVGKERLKELVTMAQSPDENEDEARRRADLSVFIDNLPDDFASLFGPDVPE